MRDAPFGYSSRVDGESTAVEGSTLTGEHVLLTMGSVLKVNN